MTSPSPQKASFRSFLDSLPQRQVSAQTSTNQIEESVLLRILVQGLVTVGITSLVLASVGVTETSWLNLTAIPLSAVGAYVSWQRRRQRNITTKFCIAIGMLVALAFFFVRLLGQPGDTRIVLAELLIHLQVLHSFDLPRRKDLGYSMVIGLILIGVAATISQTLTFGPMLVLFLAIAMPVLVIDYRSRLGLFTQQWHQIRGEISLRRFVGVMGLTLGLGLLIFAFLPRLPGYQIRTFPMSSTIEFDGQFDGQTIINPGYVSSGQGQQGDAAEETDGDLSRIQGSAEVGDGPGQVDDFFYYGFNQRMNQNLRGSMTPKVVMRVRSQAEGFWRVMAFDHYTGQGWEVSRSDQAVTLERSRFSYQTLVPPPHSNSGLPTREVVQTYTITANLPNLIPVLSVPRELYFPTREIAIDPESSLRSPVALEAGMTYTIVSRVPYRDRTRLRQTSTSYAAEIRASYLQVPEAIRDRIRQRTEEILALSPTPLTHPYEKALFLAQKVKQLYTLQPELPFFETDEDLVNAFLFEYEGGYPDHFSTALTIMLRSIGIPARLVVGFAPGEFNPFTGFYVVRNTDAYAMTEVYFPEAGWFAFDPIPGHELTPPSIEQYETFSVLKQFWNWVAGWLPSPVRGALIGVFELVTGVLLRVVNWIVNLFSQGWLGALLGTIALTAIAFGLWLLWLGLSAWQQQRQLQKLPPMEQLYQRMVIFLAQRGFPKAATETPFEFVKTLQHQPGFRQVSLVDEIVHAYVRWRYGGEEQNLDYLKTRLRSLMGSSQKGSTVTQNRH